jgi:uncharacterized protein
VLIVVDTNVIVSALLNPFGKPASVLSLILDEKVAIGLDPRILEEYQEVLCRPRFGFKESESTALVNYLEEIAVNVIAVPSGLKLKDPDDLAFVEVTLASEAKFLVTGNLKHFPVHIGHARTVNPAQFMDSYFQQ